LGSVVVGFERRTGARLGVAEFFEGGLDGADMFAAFVYTSGFGFGGRGNNILV
jgi:hypothetical protein